jgi:putative membrane protein
MRYFICIALLAGAIACKNKQSDSVRIAKEINKDKQDTGSNISMNEDTVSSTIAVEKAEADFSVEAANGNMIEIQLAALAKEKAVNPRVKNFAAMMLKDHLEMNNELQRIATVKNITLPQALSDNARKEIERLNKKEKGDFDRMYMNMMVADHRKDIDKFEKMAKNCKDTALKDFITETLPLLRKHNDSARVIDKLFVTGTTETDPPYPYHK